MRTSLRTAGLAVAACTALGTGLAPAAAAAPEPGSLAEQLVTDVTVDGVVRHLEALQAVADDNDGTRAVGTPGYDASVEYVAGALRDAGFTVDTPTFDVQTETVERAVLTLAGAEDVEIVPMTSSPSSPEGGATGPLVVVPGDGCEAADYTGLTATGAITLIARGACSFQQKQAVAAGAGAVAAIVSNNEAGPLNGTLGDTIGQIPTVGVSQDDGAVLRGLDGGRATLDLQITRTTVSTRNVVAQTSTGRTDNVVMAGAHLDSVPEGPGINDNGSGTAGLLETALQLGSAPDTENAVRFAWWSAEELGLLGAADYVAGLDEQGVADIAAYLNFDMIGSDNAGYFVYDGDDSDGEGEGPGPDGSAAIESSFVDYLAGVGIQTEGTDFDGRSDYGPFIEAGIPAGGLFTGAEDLKTEAQAVKWGGEAGVAFDPCYHQGCDTLSGVNRVALERNADALANTVGELAASTAAVNGEGPVDGPADLAAAVTAPLFSAPGTEIPVEVTVTNNGPSTSGATTVTVLTPGYAVADPGTGTAGPGGAVRFPVPVLAPGASTVVTLSATAAPGLAFGLAGAFVAPAPAQRDTALLNNLSVVPAITR
ncbi:hypothetical protein GCM10027047_02390 [Rhodococcus aerolatus]